MKLTEKIHVLKIDFEIVMSPEKKLPRFVNVLIIFDKKITLIDTGVKGSEKQIFDYIEQNNRHYSDIDTIILSHSHPDHIGSAAKIKELTKCKLFAHKGEKHWIENIELQNNDRPVPGFFDLVDHPVKVDNLLEGGQLLKADNNITLKIFHAPGHSKGSLNILFMEDRILFTADSIPLKNDIPNYDNYSDLMKTLETIKHNIDYKILLTSWTPPLLNEAEIKKTINDGKEYIQKIDTVVKETYIGEESEPYEFCRTAVKKLGLPPFLASRVVDRAFRSHL